MLAEHDKHHLQLCTSHGGCCSSWGPMGLCCASCTELDQPHLMQATAAVDKLRAQLSPQSHDAGDNAPETPPQRKSEGPRTLNLPAVNDLDPGAQPQTPDSFAGTPMAGQVQQLMQNSFWGTLLAGQVAGVCHMLGSYACLPCQSVEASLLTCAQRAADCSRQAEGLQLQRLASVLPASSPPACKMHTQAGMSAEGMPW